MKRVTCLARVAHYGAVLMTPAGRLRVRYGPMQLTFRSHEFAQFAAEIRLRAEKGGALEMRYGHASLRLRPVELRRFARMIQAAWSRLVDAQFARLLATMATPDAPDAETSSGS